MEDEMDVTRKTYERHDNVRRYLQSEVLKGRNRLRDIGVEGG
jgi:hypothetical protein